MPTTATIGNAASTPYVGSVMPGMASGCACAIHARRTRRVWRMRRSARHVAIAKIAAVTKASAVSTTPIVSGCSRGSKERNDTTESVVALHAKTIGSSRTRSSARA